MFSAYAVYIYIKFLGGMYNGTANSKGTGKGGHMQYELVFERGFDMF